MDPKNWRFDGVHWYARCCAVPVVEEGERGKMEKTHAEWMQVFCEKMLLKREEKEVLVMFSRFLDKVALPRPQASTSRPEGTREDGRTVDGRSEEREG